ncbi:hypothetical protein F4808DRAFT_236512 [Astrocystis sublimbata]|nr:hypothetical protein F4808DRAFT_236512 [Astrocystis sublimbata]
MQVTLAHYSGEMSLTAPSLLKGSTLIPDVPRQQYKKHNRPPRSQPFDPEDLRRRLYVVIAEREAQSERRPWQPVDALPAKWAQVEKEHDAQHMYIERLASAASTSARRPEAQPKLRSQPSLRNKARNRRSFFGSSEPAVAEVDTDPPHNTYRHIPDQAAAQFSRTTTSSGMHGDIPIVHGLSRAALRFYVEGASAADRQAIESSITPAKQRDLLQRAHAQHERQHGRNQFQDPHMTMGDNALMRQPSKLRRGAKEPTSAEEGAISTLADLHLHKYRDHGDVDDHHLHMSFSNEETMAVDAAKANEHRVDWSQSDQMLPNEKKGAKLTPLLRKTGSILTLKGKLSRKNHSEKHQAQSNKLKIITIQEHGGDEHADADADDGSTPSSSGSGSSRTGRPGIWGRLKRS